jgi:hypothetical protein
VSDTPPLDEAHARRREVWQVLWRAGITLLASLALALLFTRCWLFGLGALPVVCVVFVIVEEGGRRLPSMARIPALAAGGILSVYASVLAPAWLVGIGRGGPESAYKTMGAAAVSPRVLLGALGAALLVTVVASLRVLVRRLWVEVMTAAVACAGLGVLLASWSAGAEKTAAVYSGLAGAAVSLALALGELGRPRARPVEKRRARVVVAVSLALVGIELGLAHAVGASFIETSRARARDFAIGQKMLKMAGVETRFLEKRKRFANDLAELAAFYRSHTAAESWGYVFETAPGANGAFYCFVANPSPGQAGPSYWYSASAGSESSSMWRSGGRLVLASTLVPTPPPGTVQVGIEVDPGGAMTHFNLPLAFPFGDSSRPWY